jgi:hypothetical protein
MTRFITPPHNSCSTTLALAVLLMCLAESRAEARRGPGGEIGLGVAVGLPTALEIVYLPWESSFSIEAKIGLTGFVSEGYSELGFQLHTPELIRRPVYSARFSIGGGNFTMSEHPSKIGDAPGEVGGVGSVSLLVEMSAMPIQMVFTSSIRRAFVETNSRVADDFDIGGTGGFRVFF